jgi:hypothetical protein
LTAYDTAKTLSTAMTDLGTLVVTAHGLSTGEEFRFSNGLVEATNNLAPAK